MSCDIESSASSPGPWASEVTTLSGSVAGLIAPVKPDIFFHPLMESLKTSQSRGESLIGYRAP